MTVKHAFQVVVMTICIAPSDAICDQTSYRDQADSAASYIRSVQQENGEFRYEYDFLSGEWSGKDNLVRQAGTTYALAQHQVARSELGSGTAALRALDALTDRSVPFADGLVVSSDGTLASAKTGTTALALAAAILLGGDHPATGKWLNALMLLQRTDGRFRRSPFDRRSSPYYDGESWLALALAKDAGITARGLDDALALSDATLVGEYSDDPNISFFHWGQLAASVRHKTTGEALFVDFAAQQTEYYLTRNPTPSWTGNRCYAVEGLTAAFPLLKDDQRFGALADRVEERIQAELANTGSLQIQQDQSTISLRDGAQLHVAELPEFVGAFLNGRYRMQTRIDFSQHCLSAFLAASELLME